MPRRVLVSWAPHEIIMLEPQGGIIPAAVARVPIDHAVGRCELIGRVGEAADHDNWRSNGIGEPGQPTRQADKGFSMRKPARAFGEGAVARFILGAVGNVRIE